jgi:hypothetical protein
MGLADFFLLILEGIWGPKVVDLVFCWLIWWSLKLILTILSVRRRFSSSGGKRSVVSKVGSLTSFDNFWPLWLEFVEENCFELLRFMTFFDFMMSDVLERALCALLCDIFFGNSSFFGESPFLGDSILDCLFHTLFYFRLQLIFFVISIF